MSAKAIAKQIRLVLKSELPNTKFKVRANKDTVKVKWEDGDTYNDVKYAINNEIEIPYRISLELDRKYSYEFLKKATEKFCTENNIPVYEIQYWGYSDSFKVSDAGASTLGNERYGSKITDSEEIHILMRKSAFVDGKLVSTEDNPRAKEIAELEAKIKDLKARLLEAEIQLEKIK